MSRRAFERAAFQGKVAICRKRDAVVAVGRDVGAGGMLLETPEPLPARSFLTLRVVFAADRWAVTVLGRVLRSEGRRAAIEFLGLKPSERAHIVDEVLRGGALALAG
ncbi:MAG: PilZ domain-containing protein [Deltaproteobacteria bacterium]|nr:PilZ domain-containing protein [Deltaproteobacteria bacterium]